MTESPGIWPPVPSCRLLLDLNHARHFTRGSGRDTFAIWNVKSFQPSCSVDVFNWSHLFAFRLSIRFNLCLHRLEGMLRLHESPLLWQLKIACSAIVQ